MIRYFKKFYFLKVYENWFRYQFKISDVLGLSVYWHVKNNADKLVPFIKNISHTIELDLKQEEAAIHSNFSKQIKSQIKTAEAEGIICCFKQDIDAFVNFFNDFAIKKNTHLVSHRRIEEFGNNIVISFAKQNDIILAAHSYLTDKETGIVRIHHSATKRLDDNFDRNLIGRANKLLMVKDIYHFKNSGFKIFDFGGYAKDTQDTSLQGINNFKLLFGGLVVTSTNYFSYPYWFLKKISHLLGMEGKV